MQDRCLVAAKNAEAVRVACHETGTDINFAKFLQQAVASLLAANTGVKINLQPPGLVSERWGLLNGTTGLFSDGAEKGMSVLSLLLVD